MYPKRLMGNVREILDSPCNGIYHLIRLLFGHDFDSDAISFELAPKDADEAGVYNVPGDFGKASPTMGRFCTATFTFNVNPRSSLVSPHRHQPSLM